MSASSRIEAAIPSLRGTEYAVTSPIDPTYNCVAWALGDSSAWWEPVPSLVGGGSLGGYYWPPAAPLELTIEAFEAALREQGFQICDNSSLEPGFDKVVIYASSVGVPTHAARQLADGRWASKLGRFEDIEHQRPEDLEGPNYGVINRYMRRPSRLG